MTTSFLLYVIVGKLLIFLGQKFPYFVKSKIEFIRKLFECDLCLGVWIYWVLAIGAQIRLFEDVYSYPAFVGEFIAGCVTSFIVHIFSIGWRDRFSTVII